MNLKYIKNFSKKKSSINIKYIGRISISRKQMFALVFLMFSFAFTLIYAQSVEGEKTPLPEFKTVKDIIEGATFAYKLILNYVGIGWIIDVLKLTIKYIVNAQVSSVSTIAETDFGSSSMFWKVINGIKYFAVVACAYKIVSHFINTEKYDNAKSITGFFSYFGVLLLFIFSNTIVSSLVGLNSSINKYSVNTISKKLDEELDIMILKDYKEVAERLKVLDENYDKLGGFSPVVKLQNRFEYHITAIKDLYIVNTMRYIYFSFFSLILGAVLAIPVFVMTFMVKVLLSVMVAGTQIVFLLAFIPGFEDVWKKFILNMLNILLWIPIFNSVMAFILAVITKVMSNGSLESGQIIWLSIVAVILSFQAISISTSAAGTIINGAGAGIAGALGSMSSLIATSVIANTATVAVSAGVSVATGVPVSSSKSKLSKE